MKAKRLAITQLGAPVLRRIARPIAGIRSSKVQRLLDDMIVTMKHAQGVGIAAPQVGVGARAFIVAPEPSARYPKAPRRPALAMLNPRVLKRSKKTVTDWEGCLSIPGLRGRVPRHHWMEIEFSTRDGVRHRARLSGFVARIFQHEFDHINGCVYLDRVRDTRTFVTEQEYRRAMSGRPSRKRAKR